MSQLLVGFPRELQLRGENPQIQALWGLPWNCLKTTEERDRCPRLGFPTRERGVLLHSPTSSFGLFFFEDFYIFLIAAAGIPYGLVVLSLCRYFK